jgi:Mn2+/Fe2+ NRAMP family transporter
MCARLGMVTGEGLGGAIRMRYSAWVLWPACGLLLVANVFDIGADLGGMAKSKEMGTGIPSYYWTPFFALLITGLFVRRQLLFPVNDNYSSRSTTTTSFTNA